MSNVVILIGSERRNGNTELLARAFAEGAERNNSVKTISIADYDISPCCGCNSCFTRENNSCFRNDDMQRVYDILSDADIIVAASPVYFYGISAQLKALIDRLHTPLRNGFAVKRTGLLLVAASSLPEVFDGIKVQYRLIRDFFGLEDIGSVMVRDVKEKGDIKNTGALKKAYDLGASIM